MEEYIEELEQLSSPLMNKLHLAEYEELVQFVEDREPILARIEALAIKQSFSEQQKSRIAQLVKQDVLILSRMEQLKAEAGDWLNRRNRANMQRSAYEAGYSPDSILMDRKK